MTAWLARRLAAAAAGVWAVVTLTFILIHLAPGDPFRPGPERAFDPAVAAQLERQFGLDRPLPVQYVLYFRELARGNLGVSFAHRRPVADAFAEAIPNTLVLAGAALAIDFLIGLALGVYQAARARRAPDVALGNITLFLSSVPTFWLGLILLVVFGQWLGWFPVGGPHDPVMHSSLSWFGRLADRLWHLALPALTLGLVGAAGTARYQRAAMLEALGLDFVRTARARRAPDAALGNLTLFLSSVPTFWLGLILLVVFGQWLGWFPIGGPHDPVMHASFSWFGRLTDRLWHLALPALTLGLVGAAGTARYQRAAMLEALGLDFVRTARAKGAGETRVLLRHALRNALLPIITLFGLAFPFLLTGAVLTERIFAWPGMGWLAADAILARDYPVVTAAALVAAVMVAAGSLLADLLLAAADPRIRTVDA